MTVKWLTEALCLIESALTILDGDDPNIEFNSKNEQKCITEYY